MTVPFQPASRRHFMAHIARLASAVGLASCARPQGGNALPSSPSATPAGTWDLSWVDRITSTPDSAVFDIPDFQDGLMLDMATRYLDNCDAAYGTGKHNARAVLNIRTRAIPMALNDQ